MRYRGLNFCCVAILYIFAFVYFYTVLLILALFLASGANKKEIPNSWATEADQACLSWAQESKYVFQGTAGCFLCETYALLPIAYSRRSDSGVRCEVRGREERLEQAMLPCVPEAFFSRASGCFGVGPGPTDLPPTTEATSTETGHRAWKVSGTLQFTSPQVSLRKQPTCHDFTTGFPAKWRLGK